MRTETIDKTTSVNSQAENAVQREERLELLSAVYQEAGLARAAARRAAGADLVSLCAPNPAPTVSPLALD